MMQGQHHQTLNVITALKHGNNWWGNGWQEAGCTHRLHAYEDHFTK